jgi:hypothetical protein
MKNTSAKRNSPAGLLLLLVGTASSLLIPNVAKASNLAIDVNQAKEGITIGNTLKPQDLSSKLSTIHPDIKGSTTVAMRPYFALESGPSWVQNQPYLSSLYEKSSLSAVEVFQSLIS